MRVTLGAFVLPLLLLGASSVSGLANAQTIAARPLPAAAWTSSESFSRVSSVREQRDGQLIVLDEQEIRLLRVDPRSSRVTPLGRSGQGPGEYLLPITLVALPGDTTMVVDMSGGGRHILVTPAGVLSGPLRAPRADPAPPADLQYRQPSGPWQSRLRPGLQPRRQPGAR